MTGKMIFIPAVQKRVQPLAVLLGFFLLSSVHATEPVRKEISINFESLEVLTYGGVVITQQDVVTHLDTLPAGNHSELLQDAELLAGVLSKIYLSHAFLERVIKAGLLEDPELNSKIYTSLARELRNLYRNWYLDSQELEDYSVSAREIFLTQRDRFRAPDTVDMEHIMLPARDPAREVEVMSRILELHQKVASGMSFDQVFETLEGSEQDRSGSVSLEKIPTGDLLPQIGALLAQVQPGELAPPVRTQFGWHLIRLRTVNEGERLSWEEAQEQAIRMARDQHRTLNWERYLRDLQDQPYEFPEGAIAALRERFGITVTSDQDELSEIETYLMAEPADK